MRNIVSDTSIENIEAHGGDVYRNEVRLDFSVSLNPVPAPESFAEAAMEGLREMHQYPDPLQQELRDRISHYEGVAPENILCGAGASELMMAICHALRPGKALITAPCYSGYRHTLEAVGAEVNEYLLDPRSGFSLDERFIEELTEDTDIVFIADPNNPDGRLIGEDLKRQIEDRCEEHGIVLVLDECFFPLTERGLEKTEYRGSTLHLRAFTKTFAAPGIRIGYVVSADTALLERIARHLPEWNVSRVAERAGEEAARILCDTEYLRASVEMISKERAYLTDELRRSGIEVLESDANYILLRSDYDLYDRLLEQGILIRRCANFSGLDDTYYRIAVRTHEDNERLVCAIRSCNRNIHHDRTR